MGLPLFTLTSPDSSVNKRARTNPGGVLGSTAHGKHQGTIATGVPTDNCAWGDDGSVLYVTGDKVVTRIKTKMKGKGF